MNLQETIIQLNELKLRGMLSSFEAMTSLPVQNRPSLEVAISKMVDAEVPSCTEPPIPGSRHLQDGGCRGAGQTRSKDRHVSKNQQA